MKARTLVCDDNDKSVDLILWEAGAIEYDEPTLHNDIDTIVAIKGARVLDLGDHKLSQILLFHHLMKKSNSS